MANQQSSSYQSKRLDVYQFGGLNLRLSPFLQQDGELIRCVNYDKDSIGALKKRQGYTTFLGTADGNEVVDVFSWSKNDGTSTYIYRHSGSKIYFYDINGTVTDWTVCGNGTVLADYNLGYAEVNGKLYVCQEGGTLLYTTTGTSWVNVGTTTLGSTAPSGQYLAEYNQSLYIAGTTSTLYKSSTGDGANWQTSGTSDSTSIDIPAEGKLGKIFKCNDRLVITKNSGRMFTWDEYSLRNVPTNQGPSAPKTVAELEDYYFYLNQLGIRGFNGNRPQLLSNPIQRQIFNENGTGINSYSFRVTTGIVYLYDYYVLGGNITDDLTYEPITNCILKYSTQLDEWSNYTLYNNISSWTTYRDFRYNTVSPIDKLIFCDDNGQCYLYGNTTSDNGKPIQSIAELVIHCGAPSYWKYFQFLRVFASPGCEATVSVAIADTFARRNLEWVSLGDLKDGYVRYRINGKNKNRGKFLFVRFSDNSSTASHQIYGFTVEYDLMPSA